MLATGEKCGNYIQVGREESCCRMKAVTPVTLITMRRDDQMSRSNFCFPHRRRRCCCCRRRCRRRRRPCSRASGNERLAGGGEGEKKVKCLITVQSQLSFVPNTKGCEALP